MKRKAAWCVVLLAVLLLTGCGADISAYGDRQIRVSGLLEEDFYVTPNELSRLKCVSETATGATDRKSVV